MQPSHNLSNLRNSMDRVLMELNNAVIKQIAHKSLLACDITYTKLNFFIIAEPALYNDIFCHAIRVFDEHKDAKTFWYILRSNELVIRKNASKTGLDLSQLENLSKKLRHIREKTLFHVDREALENPATIWSAADIDGGELIDKINKTFQTVALSKSEIFNTPLEKITEYNGTDVARTLSAIYSVYGSLHELCR